ITLNDAELKAFHDTHSKFFKIRRFVNRSALFKYWKSGKLIASKILFTLMNKEYLQYHLDLYSDSEKWKIFTNSLSEINTLCKEKQVPLLTVVFPMFTHAFDEEYPFKAVHTQIDSFLESVNIANLDLLPFYEGIPPERLQASVGEDAHPNEIANRIAADAIYDKLSRDKMVPDDLIVKRMRAKGRVPLHIYPFRDTINELNQVEERPETEANNLEIAK
ncbi:MAG: hypothetical protein KBC84_10875, partial [Proteobacteria bacterium]|nr:hypothetical protein [Pseudomonadota bacterium]